MITKICGIKNKETLICCEENKVDFFGMIFFKNSPRNISIEEAKNLQILSKNLKIIGVGVFVNENINNLKELIKKLQLTFIQLHGDEDDDYIKEIKNDINVIKKISLDTVQDLDQCKNFKNSDYFLFDYKPSKNELPGGNAKSFNWNIVKNLKIGKPWFLSGGVKLDNIKEIKTDINPYGIDLSSGVEKELGIKDNHIINNFIESLKNA